MCSNISVTYNVLCLYTNSKKQIKLNRVHQFLLGLSIEPVFIQNVILKDVYTRTGRSDFRLLGIYDIVYAIHKYSYNLDLKEMCRYITILTRVKKIRKKIIMKKNVFLKKSAKTMKF